MLPACRLPDHRQVLHSFQSSLTAYQRPRELSRLGNSDSAGSACLCRPDHQRRHTLSCYSLPNIKWGINLSKCWPSSYPSLELRSNSGEARRGSIGRAGFEPARLPWKLLGRFGFLLSAIGHTHGAHRPAPEMLTPELQRLPLRSVAIHNSTPMAFSSLSFALPRVTSLVRHRCSRVLLPHLPTHRACTPPRRRPNYR